MTLYEKIIDEHLAMLKERRNNNPIQLPTQSKPIQRLNPQAYKETAPGAKPDTKNTMSGKERSNIFSRLGKKQLKKKQLNKLRYKIENMKPSLNNKVKRWKESKEGRYMAKHCLTEYYATLKEIEMGW